MANYVTIAVPVFQTAATERGMRDLVCKETADTLRSLQGWGIDLVVLCEGVEAFAQTVNTGESLDDPGPMLTMYREQAMELQAYIAASVKIREGSNVYNSQVFISPEGRFLGAYHKCNLTVIELEKGLRPGQEAKVIDTPIGRLGGIICFDLNFRWLLDQYIQLRPDILCFSSMYHGGAMVQGMWAYECRSYFASALPFAGGGVVAPDGRILDTTHNSNPNAITRVNIDKVLLHCDFNRPRFKDIQATYGQDVRIEIPAFLGTATLYSESEERSALDICEEFDLETLDAYFSRSLAANAEAGGQGLAHPTRQSGDS